MTDALLLTADDLVQLTGYRQHARQFAWLRDRLRIAAPLRADGMPIVTRAQLEAAIAGKTATGANPKWSKIAV